MNDKSKVQQIKVDYIIVGQGIAGTWLAHELLQKGLQILVIDNRADKTSSRKAAGLYNPITGRKMVKTWRADDLFLNLENDYKSLQDLLGESFLHSIPIYRPFLSVEDQNDWDGRMADSQYDHYIEKIPSSSLGLKDINDPFGGIILKNCGYVDLPKLLDSYRNYLIDKGIYHEELFDYSEMDVESEEVRYKEWSARKIIFCEGPDISKSHWQYLPFRFVRGETIDIECELKSGYVINQGIFMIPKGGYYTVGSTYDHKILSYEPQTSGIEEIEQRMSRIFSGAYRIIEKRAGIRPATHDRKPYIGFHKSLQNVAIFNGFGTKGVSLTPYFAKHFADVLENRAEIEKDVDVKRVS